MDAASQAFIARGVSPAQRGAMTCWPQLEHQIGAKRERISKIPLAARLTPIRAPHMISLLRRSDGNFSARELKGTLGALLHSGPCPPDPRRQSSTVNAREAKR